MGAVDVRQPPHSTFKIWNTLIALETGAAPDAGFQQRYDPVKYPHEDWWPETWLQDQTLESAFRRSAVWYYRELALRVGAEAMQTRLSRLGYGNADISSGLDSFWLGGSLRISPREQVALLARLARGEVPFSPEHVATLRRIMVLDQGEGWTLSGKTGLGELGLGRFGGRFGAGSRAGSWGWRSGRTDLRLRHLPARPRHEDLRPAPHRADPAGAGVAGCCRKRRGEGGGGGKRASPQPLLKIIPESSTGGREGCQAATGWLLAGRGRQLHGSPWGTGAGVAIVP